MIAVEGIQGETVMVQSTAGEPTLVEGAAGEPVTISAEAGASPLIDGLAGASPIIDGIPGTPEEAGLPFAPQPDEAAVAAAEGALSLPASAPDATTAASLINALYVGQMYVGTMTVGEGGGGAQEAGKLTRNSISIRQPLKTVSKSHERSASR